MERLVKRRQKAMEVTAAIANDILKDVGGPIATHLRSCIRTSDWAGVISQPMPIPDNYDCADAFARDYQSYSLLRKYPDFDLGIDRVAVAIEAFYASEASCSLVNSYGGFLPYTFDSDSVSSDRTLEAILFLARDKISKLLGKFSWNNVEHVMRFSGGASTRLKRESGDAFYKLQGRPHVTRTAALLAVCAIWHNEGWREYAFQNFGSDPMQWVIIVEGSKYTTVPKTAKTDRGICIEPEMNMFLQLGIGALIRKALKKARIDLNDQTVNQTLARIGSCTGSLSTIDLKSASDSIALQLVKLLMPWDWYEALLLTRCEYTRIGDRLHRLEKISSMGNGYTFELESLIFWAISASVLELEGCEDKRLGVYGDDIVVHNSVADRLIGVLSNLGFETNIEKTFVSGPFRESCGKHYFYGADVSPFSITKSVDSPNRLFLHWNQCKGWWVPLDKAAGHILRRLPKPMRSWSVPFFESPESGLIRPFDQAHPRWSKKHQHWWYRCLRPRRQKHEPNGHAAVLAWTMRARGGRKPSHDVFRWFCESSDPYILEKGDVRYTRSIGKSSRWDALG